MNDKTIQFDDAASRPFGEDCVGHDPTTDTFHARFDPGSDTLVCVIVETVGAVANRDPTAMEPLYATVDPEALATLLTEGPRPVEVAFSYEGCRVTVSSHGSVVVERRRDR